MYSHDVAVTQEERTLAMLAHLLGIFTAFVGPLVLYLVRRDSRFIAFHALQAVFFQLAFNAALVIAGMLIFLLVGFILLPVVLVGGIIYAAVAAFKAYQGEWFEYWLVGPIARRSVEA